MKPEGSSDGQGWRPIDSAPKDGTRFVARKGKIRLVTWFGKTSHVPLYGWCHGRCEDVGLWEPTEWMPKSPTSGVPT